jgi:hypothetical protein
MSRERQIIAEQERPPREQPVQFFEVPGAARQ